MGIIWFLAAAGAVGSFRLTGDAFVAVFGVTVVLVGVGLVLGRAVRG